MKINDSLKLKNNRGDFQDNKRILKTISTIDSTYSKGCYFYDQKFTLTSQNRVIQNRKNDGDYKFQAQLNNQQKEQFKEVREQNRNRYQELEEYGSIRKTSIKSRYKSIEKLYGFTVKIRDNGRESFKTVLQDIQKERSVYGDFINDFQPHYDSEVKQDVIKNEKDLPSNELIHQQLIKNISDFKRENTDFQSITTKQGYFIGQFFDQQLNGQGIILNIKEQLEYMGGFEENKLDGFGILFNQETNKLMKSNDQYLSQNEDHVIRYEGLFKENQKHGIGYLYYDNGDTFFGEFFQDKATGYGVYYNSLKNKKTCGIWKEGDFIKSLVQFINY